MTAADRQARRILAHLETRIDPAHRARARARLRAALDSQPLDAPPLVFYLPYQGGPFTPYPAAQAFADPASHAVNELLTGFTSLYHAVALRDDAPYCVRPNLGTGIVASMFGAQVRLLEENPPWTEPLGEAGVRRIVAEPLPPVEAGLGRRVLDQYEYFRELLADFPACERGLQLTLPDLQGPFSTAELLWGTGIYLALYDCPELVTALLERIVAQMVAVVNALSGQVRDDLGAGYGYQHGVATRGRILVRNDSMINLSPRQYRDIVLPYDTALSEALGGIGVHFCGRGMHQVSNLLAIPGLGCLDIGNPELLDLDALYSAVTPHEVALVRLAVPVEQLRAATLTQRFPTGVILVCPAETIQQARALLSQYWDS